MLGKPFNGLFKYIIENVVYITEDNIKGFYGAIDRNRTDDLLLTMEMLYQLSYNGKNARLPV